jgi:hypothetical protein
MVAAFLLCSAMLGQAASPARDLSADLKAYQEARSRAGRTADDQVELALWCEARGLDAERLTHLTRATLLDPDNQTARGLLGQVSYKGKWMRPEGVQAAIEADPDAQATLREYLDRRAATAYTADAQQRLAQWCDQHDLKDQATAHYKNVLRIDPRREPVWKKLGYRKHEGRWVTPEDLAAEKAEADAQKHADRRWKPLLEKYRDELTGKDEKKRRRAEDALAGITDLRAVPMIWDVFVRDDKGFQLRAAETLAQIDGPSASQAVARLAVFSDFPEVRGLAAKVLMRRDPHDFLDPLLDLIRKPFRYKADPVRDDGSGGKLFVEGEEFNIERTYQVGQIDWSQIPRRIFTDDVPLGGGLGQNALALGFGGAGVRNNAPLLPVANREAIRRDRIILQAIGAQEQVIQQARQSERRDMAAIEQMNRAARNANERVLPLVKASTGQDFGDDRDAWKGWWSNELGYAYRSSTPSVKPTYTEFVAFNPILSVPHGACFAAGTPVLTIDGPKPIESIEVGDRVLAQDVATGAISYQPVLLTHHNAPSPLLKLTIGPESLLATGIHRFWRVGKGWTMARDLKPGDVVRTLGGAAKVEASEPAGTAPVFNLDVAEDRDFFVGKAGFLVYDFSVVQPVARPFDAPAVASLDRTGSR